MQVCELCGRQFNGPQEKKELEIHVRLFHGKNMYQVGVSCPECGSRIVNQEGCELCLNCGWSKCG